MRTEQEIREKISELKNDITKTPLQHRILKTTQEYLNSLDAMIIALNWVLETPIEELHK